MVAQPFSHRRGTDADQHAYVRHALAPLFTKEAAIPLHEVDEQSLDLALKIWRH
jgi:hypothetical protein